GAPVAACPVTTWASATVPDAGCPVALLVMMHFPSEPPGRGPLGSEPGGLGRGSAGHLVAGLVDRGADRRVVDLPPGHGHGAGVQADADPVDPGNAGDLAGDRVDAVLAAHALDGVCAAGHHVWV